MFTEAADPGGPTQRTKFQMCQIVTSLGMRE